MKRILILLGLMAATSLGMKAENRTVTDTVDGKKRVIELQDTVINGQQTTDTLSITTYEGTDSSEADSDGTYRHRHDRVAGCNGWASTSAKTHRKQLLP